MKKTFFLLALLSFVAMSASYVGVGEIKTMQNAYGGWLLSTSGAANNPETCSKNIVILENTHPQYKEMYSLLLAAYTANKQVNIAVQGCHEKGYKILSFVYTAWNK